MNYERAVRRAYKYISKSNGNQRRILFDLLFEVCVCVEVERYYSLLHFVSDANKWARCFFLYAFVYCISILICCYHPLRSPSFT